MKDYVIRFSVRERVEHAVVTVLFLVLAVTGLPQEFFWQSWARWLILAMGGIERVRWVHRGAGVLFAALVVWHLAVALVQMSARRVKASLVPTRKDFQDAVGMMRYYLRLADQPPRFDRFDYRQKFEYWGMVIGSTVIIATGFMLLFPVETARLLPGQLIPAALLMHGREGLLAFLVIIIWHLYNAHLSPDVFPFDASIFTGKVSVERMEKEHGLEYERILAAERPKQGEAEPAKAPVPAGAGAKKADF